MASKGSKERNAQLIVTFPILLIFSKGAFHLSGLAELKELVLAGINGKRKSTPRKYPRASCAKRIAIFRTQNSRTFRK